MPTMQTFVDERIRIDGSMSNRLAGCSGRQASYRLGGYLLRPHWPLDTNVAGECFQAQTFTAKAWRATSIHCLPNDSRRLANCKCDRKAFCRRGARRENRVCHDQDYTCRQQQSIRRKPSGAHYSGLFPCECFSTNILGSVPTINTACRRGTRESLANYWLSLQERRVPATKRRRTRMGRTIRFGKPNSSTQIKRLD